MVKSLFAVDVRWRNERWLAVILLGLALNLLVYLAIWRQPTPTLRAGEAAHNFTAYDASGVSTLRDQDSVLINFVSANCAVCLDELATLDGWRRSAKVPVWIVAADQLSAEEWQSKNFPVALDGSGALADAYAISGYPSSVIVRGGFIESIRYGGPFSLDQFDRFAESVLNDNP